MLRLHRTFINNNHYEEHLPYGDALVCAVDFLYDNTGDVKYSLQTYNIIIPDFMTIVQNIIHCSVQKQAKASIIDCVSLMYKAGRGSSMKVSYSSDSYVNYLDCEYVHIHVVEMVLWTAFIYCMFRAEIEKTKGDDEELAKYKNAYTDLMDYFVRLLHLKKDAFDQHYLLKRISQTLLSMLKKHDLINITDEQSPIDVNIPKEQSGEVTAIFERKDKLGNTVTKSITARGVSGIVMKYPWKEGMTKEQMQKMLSEITGLSESSFKNALVE